MDYSYKGIWKFALPVMFSSFAEFAIAFADTSFLGHVGAYEINLAGTAGLIHLCALMFIMGMSFGAQIWISRLFSKSKEKAQSLFLPVLGIMSALAIGAVLVFQLLGPYFYPFLIKDAHLREGIEVFLKMRSWGYIPAAFSMALTAYIIGQGISRPLIWSTLIITLSNIGLDYALIFGSFGEPMGAIGASIASVIAETLGFITLFGFVLFHFKGKCFEIPPRFTYHIKGIAKLGTPLMFQKLMSLGAWTLFFLAIEKIGLFELATSQLIRSLYYLTLIPVMSIGTITKSYISFYSHHDISQILKVKNRLAWVSLVLTFAFVHGFALYPEVFLSILTDQPELIATAKPIIQALVGAMLLFSFAHILFATIEGLGYTRWAFYVELLSIVLYLSLVFGIVRFTNFGLFTVWMTDYIYFAFMGVLSLLLLKYKFKWLPKKID